MSDLRASRVLVTGAGGFIGGHLTTRLLERGARVRALVRYNSRGDRGTLDWFPPDAVSEVEVVAGDLRDVESVAKAIGDAEVVLHLGAQVAIPYSYANPRDFFEVNVLGSFNVAQASLAGGVQRLIHVSTSEVYGSAQEIPITERHPLDAQSPYAASKVGAEKLMDSYYRSFELPTTIVRPFNTYGPHQSARAVIPTIISQALAGEVLRLGSLHPRRDLTYVLDTADGMIAAALEPQAIGATMNLGTGEDVSIGEIVELVGDLLGKELNVEHDEDRVRPEASEVQRLVSSPAKVAELTGWRAATSLREGLGRTIEWIERNPHRYRIGEYAI